MSYIITRRGFLVRIARSSGSEESRQDADIWTEAGWESGSCLALDSETLDRELDAKLEELITKGVEPGSQV